MKWTFLHLAMHAFAYVLPSLPQTGFGLKIVGHRHPFGVVLGFGDPFGVVLRFGGAVLNPSAIMGFLVVFEHGPSL